MTFVFLQRKVVLLKTAVKRNFLDIFEISSINEIQRFTCLIFLRVVFFHHVPSSLRFKIPCYNYPCFTWQVQATTFQFANVIFQKVNMDKKSHRKCFKSQNKPYMKIALLEYQILQTHASLFEAAFSRSVLMGKSYYKIWNKWCHIFSTKSFTFTDLNREESNSKRLRNETC